MLNKHGIEKYDAYKGIATNGDGTAVTANVDGIRVTVHRDTRGTPVRIARGRAGSALRTAGSTISSLTDSTPRMRTRATGETATLFDSGISSDLEDGSELDDEDDYQMRMNGLIPGDEDLEDSEEDKDEDGSDGLECTVQQLLKRIDFAFKAVAETEAVKDTSQPEYYDGPSGLRPGVSEKLDSYSLVETQGSRRQWTQIPLARMESRAASSIRRTSSSLRYPSNASING